MAKSLSRLSPASPSFSATSTVGFASSPAETTSTSRRGLAESRRGRSETDEKADERGSFEEREAGAEGLRRDWRRRVCEAAIVAAAREIYREKCRERESVCV